MTPKQRAFVHEYLVDLCIKSAAIRAGYAEKNAHVQGSRMMRNPEVKALIQEEMDRRARVTKVTANRVVEEISHSAFGDVADVLEVDEHGRVFVRDLKKLPKSVTRAISEITQVTTEVTNSKGRKVEKVRLQVKMNPKLTALKLLMDHLGIGNSKTNEGPDLSDPSNSPVATNARNKEYDEMMHKLFSRGAQTSEPN